VANGLLARQTRVFVFIELTMNNGQLTKVNPLFVKADLLAKEVYRACLQFPKHEQYGLTSQLRRAALSVILNIIEGFARQSKKEFRRFLLIAFGSLKETKYILYFSLEQKFLSEEEYKKLLLISEEVAKILWSIIRKSE
jgi:four helix bundle protein